MLILIYLLYNIYKFTLKIELYAHILLRITESGEWSGGRGRTIIKNKATTSLVKQQCLPDQGFFTAETFSFFKNRYQ